MSMEIEIQHQHFIAAPEKVLFWKEEKMLLIADAHFSKENHFRKNGIAVPNGILQFDLQRIEQLIERFLPRTILFLGDMFHSEANEGMTEFFEWRKKCTGPEFQLVIGNHDILQRDWYQFAGIQCIDEQLAIGDIILSHDKLPHCDGYNFYGHIHPCVRLSGKAHQSVRLPCFWFGENAAALPAFGRFTGSRTVRPAKTDRIIAIGDNSLFTIQ